MIHVKFSFLIRVQNGLGNRNENKNVAPLGDEQIRSITDNGIEVLFPVQTFVTTLRGILTSCQC